MLPNNQNQNQKPKSGAHMWPPVMFHTRSTPVPHPFHTRSRSIKAIKNQFIKVMDEGCDHANPDEEFDWSLEQMSAAQLATLGRIYLDMAEWKLSSRAVTLGVTRGNVDVAGDSEDELPGCNSVTEFPAAPKMPTLAPIGKV